MKGKIKMNNNLHFDVTSKETYDTPRITIIYFDAEIITTSTTSDPNQGEWDVD